ncbi:uncharacterized protein LOC126404345 isoform X2 [Epinephelus moara]|uniref:uncharacterized protein LOC126404345 isoform X2 n=1 Tax=Epinephelus moara TaxID=300413 RepID=UPI00214EC51D|nr:uncharacterized protein LOC126404345 isoform X2 [Epinephelus moara]
MMKLWSRLCFLVLATSSISRGQNVTAVSQDGPVLTTSPPLMLANATQNDAARTPPTPSPQTQTSVNATDLSSQNITTPEKGPQSTDDVVTTQEVNGKAAQTTAPVSTAGGGRDGVTTVTTVAIATTSASPTTAIASTAGSSWGYAILVLIILVIIVLCAILYFLRRVSRTYSFDLHRQVPANHLDEPIGTFEPVYLDDLDQPAPKDQVTTDDLSPPPVSNGTPLQSEEHGSNGETAPQEQPDANGLQPSPASNSSPSLDDNPADKTPSPLSSTNLFFDGIGEEQQNENNNNPSVCSSDPFVEINLDEPAWCDQFLTSPEASSSVLPFTPFSFSSSPSSS